MEREASVLRCAKLSSYAEFNRMVHAIARSGGEAGFQRMSGAKMVEGTGTEYFFYTTLASMLNQVVRNTNKASQQVELQQVYQWFSTNKPLISDVCGTMTKTNPNIQKPKLSLSKRSTDTLQRPQTAPATLNIQSYPAPLPPQPCSSGARHSRPHTAQPTQHGFTSGYMSRSLSLSPHKTTHLSASHSRAATPSLTQDTPAAKSGRIVGPGSYGHRPGDHHVSLVEVPSQQSLCSPLNITTLLQLAPAVAATMEWQREIRQEQEAGVITPAPSMDIPVPLEHRAEEDISRKEIAVTTTHTQPAGTGPTLQPEKSQPQPSSDSSLSQSQSNSTPMITLIPPQATTHTVKTHSPVHVVTLDLPVCSPPSHTTRPVPSGLKRSGPKAASGFNCSRYRPRSVKKANCYSGSTRIMQQY